MGAVWRQILGIALGGACVFSTNCATAQITPDRTLPNNSSVTINGSVFNITLGTQAGRNLFHSFQQFSVPTEGTASFLNGADIQNIISRVTGGSASNIDGLIKASGTANLFFLNPNGIVFGKNASLNIGGSFVATTANAIQFGNLGTFSASVPNNPALLTVNPSALLYNQIAASIQNNSQASVNGNVVGLQVPDGKSLLLVGGEINVNGGGLTAHGGRVELASLAAPGTVGLNVAGDSLSLSVPSGVQRSDVSLSNQAVVDVRSAGGGDIAVNARNLNVLSNSVLFAGIGTGLGNGSSTKAGDININADAISVDSGYIDNVVFSSASKGNAGNINITTGSLSATNGAEINSFTRGVGNAGNVTITAKGAVTFDGGNSGLFSNVLAGGVGNGGKIDITAGTLSLTNGSQLNISVNGASNTFAAGQGIESTINLNVANALTISGTNSGVFANLSTGAVGRGGNINIQAGEVFVRDGAQINSFTRGTGNAGNIDITTGSLSATNGAQINSFTRGTGNAGNVTIIARDAVAFDGEDSNGNHSGSFSSVETGGVGNGGNVNITAGSLSLTNGGNLNTSITGQGNAGNVRIDIRENFSLDGEGRNGRSGVLSDVNQSGIGNAGDIFVKAGSLSITNGAGLSSTTRGQGNENSDIFANAFSGSGGKIQINATGIFGLTVLSREYLVRLLGTNDLTQLEPQQLPTNAITAISQTNPTLSGTVVINTANINPSQGLLQLSTNLINPNTLIANSCIARTQKQQGTFNITGTGGLPNRPGDASISSYPTGTVRNVQGNSTSSSWHRGDPIVEPQGVYQLPNGHLVLSRECS